MLAVALFLCRGGDIWYDELFTMGLASQSLPNLISVTARDVHPPLYYMLVKLSLTVNCGLGEPVSQVTAAKLMSVLPFGVMLGLSATELRRQFGLFAAGLFSFLMVSMPQLSGYIVEIRMYGYAMLFVLSAMLCAYRIAKAPLQGHPFAYPGLVLCCLAAGYTHYFACAAAGMVYLYLLAGFVRAKVPAKKWLPFAGSALVFGAGYLPWILGAVANQMENVGKSYWIQPVSLRSLGGCVKFIFQPAFANGYLNAALAVLFFGVYAGLFLMLLVQMVRKKEGKAEYDFIAGCAGVLLGLVLFGMAASVLFRPIFVYRYMLPAFSVFWLAFALLSDRVVKRKELLLFLLFLTAMTGVRNFRAFYGEEMWKFKQMEQVEKAFSKIGREDILLFNFGQLQAVTAYYLENDTYLWYEQPEELVQEMYPAVHSLTGEGFTDEKGIARIQEFLSQGKTVRFLGSGNAREEILEKWEKEGIRWKEEDSVMLERYWFNIYTIWTGED